MNTLLKRMIYKKDCKKAKHFYKHTERDEYNKNNNVTLNSKSKARWNYINKMLFDVMTNVKNKPFWQSAKSQQKENIGVAQITNLKKVHNAAQQK